MSAQEATGHRSGESLPWSVIKKVAVIIGYVITAFGTIVAIYQWYDYLNSQPELSFNVIDNQWLTKPSNETSLNCKFDFKGNPVRNLWMSRIRVANTCRKNIIGVNGFDLLSSNICFVASDPYRILLAVLEPNDVGLNLDFDAKQLALSFRKWHAGRDCIIRVYSEGESETGVGPTFRLAFDPLSQGEVVISDYKESTAPKPLLKHYPALLSFFAKWVGILFFSALGICTFYLFVFSMGWLKFIRFLRWNKKYLERVRKLAENKDTENSRTIYELPKEFWIEHQIPAPPARSSLVKGARVNWGEIWPPSLLALIALLVVFVALSALIEI